MTVVYASAERLAAMREKALKAEALTVRCSDCDWTFEGRADVAMRRHRDHRVKRHGRPESSDVRWHDEPPRTEKFEPKPLAEEDARAHTEKRERVLGLLRERGESSAAELAKELGAGYSTGSVSTTLGWARRDWLVEVRETPGRKGKLWRPAGTEPGPDPEPEPRPVATPTVADALRGAGRPMTVAELADATGRAKTSVSTSLTKAVAAGEAERVGRGLYRAGGG